jgi:hypothetical protein
LFGPLRRLVKRLNTGVMHGWCLPGLATLKEVRLMLHRRSAFRRPW